MKSRSSHHQHRSSSSPSSLPHHTDDWSSGSWTVDCSCGVTFDDGEEMVSCDLCAVWVHTRCSRYVRGDPSFACHNCLRHHADDVASQETEVAQLLAELPNKPLLSGPPRFYSEIPIEDRVHVQGVPGGEPGLFNRSGIFSSKLWECTGYVPKKFNFQYREFASCFDEDDKGADMLINLSKENSGFGGKKERSRSRVSGMRNSAKRRREEVGDGDGFGKDRRDSVGFLRVRANGVEKEVDLGGGVEKEEIFDEPSSSQLKDGSKNDFEPQGLIGENNSGKNAGKLSDSNLKQQSSAEAFRDLKNEVLRKACILAEEAENGEAKESSKQKVSCRDLHNLKHANEERSVKVDLVTCNDTIATGSESSKPANLDLIRKVKVPNNVSVPDSDNTTLENAQFVKINGKTDGAGDQLAGKSDLLNCVVPGRNSHNTHAAQLEESEVKFSENVLDKVINEAEDARRQSRDCCQDLNDEGKSFRTHESKKQEEEISAMEKVSAKKQGPKCSVFQDNSSLKVSSSSTPLISRSTSSDQQSDTKISVSKMPHNNLKHQRVKLSTSTACKLETEADAISAEESMGEDPKYFAKGNSRGHLSSGSRSSHTCRVSYSSSTKNMASGTKETIPLPPSRFSTKDEASMNLDSSANTGMPQSASSSLKMATTTVSQKNEKTHSQVSFASSEETKNSMLLHPQSSSIATTALSDEELALLLHQELNSSPRVPRVPRIRQAVGMQLPSSGSMNVFSKRPSLPVGKDHVSVSRRKSKDDVSRDHARECQRHDLSEEIRRKDRTSSSPDRKYKESSIDLYTKKDVFTRHSDTLASVKTKTSFQAESADSGSSSFDINGQSALPIRNTLKDAQKDDNSSLSHTLPGLIGEIMSKNRHISFEELCAAVRPHWSDLRKPNGERYAYTSHLHAVQDCLRNRDEWSHLIDQSPKTTSSKKRRKNEPDVPKFELENEKGITGAPKEAEETSVESHKEDIPKGKRNHRKRRRLELKGRVVVEDRKNQDKKSALDKDNATSSPLSNGENETQFSEDGDADDNNDDDDENSFGGVSKAVRS